LKFKSVTVRLFDRENETAACFVLMLAKTKIPGINSSQRNHSLKSEPMIDFLVQPLRVHKEMKEGRVVLAKDRIPIPRRNDVTSAPE